ncbi:MAG: pyridoxal-phosphate dependent enzyme, partial [Nitrospiraceae bacterium]|nr:pyridoxal-phosphate dependent enzyme [Nitrospiraceae bacterium]
GYYAGAVTRETGGGGEDVSDLELIEAIKLLAATEGVFAETAGGVTLAAAKKLIEAGRIDRDSITVVCITGNGLKTQEALAGHTAAVHHIKPNLSSFEDVLKGISLKGR